MATIALGLISVLVTILFLIYKSKYSTLNQKVESIIKNLESPIRKGYYKLNCHQGLINYTGIIYVSEIDRYKNGESKISLDYVEIDTGDGKLDYQSAKSFLTKSFVSLMKTSEIEWLESENDLKELRKNKLEHLKDVLNENKRTN